MIARLHYISQAAKNGTHLDAIKQVLQSGGKWIQLRIKDQAEDQVLQYAVAAKKICDQYGAKLIINDFPNVARAVGCFGVHLGLQDMPIAVARKIIGKEQVIGGTANTFEDILQRSAEGVDYIGLGPYRFTPTKKNLSPIIGLEGYQKIMEAVKHAGINIPIIAIGGVEVEDIQQIMATGIYGIALSAALTNQADTAGFLEQVYQKMGTVVI